MKKLLIALSLLVSSYALAQGFTEVRNIVHQITVGQGRASSVVIAEGYALTSAHVTDIVLKFPKAQIMIETSDGPVKGKVVKVDEVRDLALVAANVHCPCAKLAENNPPMDEPVVIVGFPLPRIVEMQVATRGEVQGIDTSSGLMLITANITFGNSGGGAFQISTGELVGIADSVVGVPVGPPQFGITDMHHYMALTVPIERIREFLNLQKGQPTPSQLKSL